MSADDDKVIHPDLKADVRATIEQAKSRLHEAGALLAVAEVEKDAIPVYDKLVEAEELIDRAQRVTDDMGPDF